MKNSSSTHFGPGKFRLLLIDELASRRIRKPRYSIKSFAQQLEVSHFLLAKIVKGTPYPNVATIERVGRKLNLDEKTIEGLKKERANLSKNILVKMIDRLYEPPKSETLELLKEPEHYVILSLLELRKFIPNLSFVAQQLETTLKRASTMVERLQNLHLLQIKESSWNASHPFSTSVNSENDTSAAHREGQKKSSKKEFPL